MTINLDSERLEASIRQVVREELRPLVELLDRLASGSAAGSDARALLTTAEAARIAKVTPATIRDWVKSGKLKGYSSGRRVLVRLDDLLALLGGNADLVGQATRRELRLLRLTPEGEDC